MYSWVLMAHILGASIWIGGHLYLIVSLLPAILKNRDVARLLAFEQSYEKLGMVSLLVQVITGLYLAKRLVPDISMWFGGAGVLSALLTIKLSLLAMTIMVALHARFRAIPKLNTDTLPVMAVHIIAIGVLGVAFLMAGVAIRLGGLF